MPKAKFIGDPANELEVIPDAIEAFGVTFLKGKASTISSEVAKKLKTNSHFEIIKESATKEGA